jgi:5'-3' exoribonuclease 1
VGKQPIFIQNSYIDLYAANTITNRTVETQNFFLIHLSILREYLELEFQELREMLPFPYDFERIIDDYVMMAMFIGNDFLPHLPYLHINEGAMALMFSAYKRILPQLDGYLNDGGIIDFAKAELLIRELDVTEDQAFEQEQDNEMFLESKRAARKQRHKREAQEVATFEEVPLPKIITEVQSGLIDSMEEFINNAKISDTKELHLTSNLSAGDQAFVYIMCDRFGLVCDEQRDESVKLNGTNVNGNKSSNDESVVDNNENKNNDEVEEREEAEKEEKSEEEKEEEESSDEQNDLEDTYHLCVHWEENKTEAQYKEILAQLRSLTVLGPEDLDVEKAEKEQLVQKRIEWNRSYYQVCRYSSIINYILIIYKSLGKNEC